MRFDGQLENPQCNFFLNCAEEDEDDHLLVDLSAQKDKRIVELQAFTVAIQKLQNLPECAIEFQDSQMSPSLREPLRKPKITNLNAKKKTHSLRLNFPVKLILECIKRKDNGKLRRDKWTKRIDSTKGRNRGLQRNEYHAASKLSFHEETAQEQVLLTMVKIVGGDLDLRQAEALPLRLEIAQTTLQNRALQQPRTTSCLSHAAAKSFRDFQRTQGIQAPEMPLLEFIPEQLKKPIPF
nr:hypothetical protein Iba_chr12fCG13870 [Ipomoea batatas]